MNNENGRSMVEMLGVLAIIGVLSVAGIGAYSMAMKKYRANEIIATASTFYMLSEAKRLSGNLSGAGYGVDGTSLEQAGMDKPFGTVDMTYDYETSTVTIENAEDVCDIIQSTFGEGRDFSITCS